MRKKALIGSFCLFILVAGVVGTVCYIKKAKRVTVRPIKISELQISSDFYLTGVIEPETIIDYKFDKNRGVISEKKVNIGDSVEKGQALYLYQNPDGDMKIKEAELMVLNGEKKVEQKRLEYQLKQEQYETYLSRQQEVNKESTEGKEKQELEELRQKKDDLVESIIQAEIEMGQVGTEIEEALLEVEKSTLELAKLKGTQGNHEVLSDIQGTVQTIDESQINAPAGDKPPEQPFLSIVDTSTFYLRGKVDEYRQNNLAIDQKVTVIDRNDSSKTWKGKITKVGNLAAGGIVDEEQGGNPNLSQFTFEVTLETSEVLPKIGLHCFAEIEKEASDGQVTVPQEYLVKEKNTHYLWQVKNKQLIKKKVEVTELVEESGRYVLKDQTMRDSEIVYPNSSFSEGMEVDGNDSTN